MELIDRAELVNIDIERQKRLIQEAMKKGMEDKEDGVR